MSNVLPGIAILSQDLEVITSRLRPSNKIVRDEIL